MQTLLHGNNFLNVTEGSVLLRNLIVMFVVIICFAFAIASMTSIARQSSKYLENVKEEIAERNLFFSGRINR